MLILKSLKKPQFSVKNAIHQRLAGFEPPRPHYPLRASDLLKKDYEFCPREHAFMDLALAKKKDAFVGTALRMTFGHGHFMEDSIRNEYLRDIAVGNWECHVCGHEHPTFGKAPTVKCPSCGWPSKWKYKEPRFKDPYTDVSGGIDLLLDVGQPKLLLIEIKTMSPDEFKSLAAPLAEHKARTSLYLQLAASDPSEISKRINTQEARVLYATKSFGFKDETLKAAGIKDAGFSPFKEFTLTRQDSLNTTPLNKARTLKVWRGDKQGMPCGICQNGFTKRAQSCSAAAPCWSGKFPSTLTWLEGGLPKHAGKTLTD